MPFPTTIDQMRRDGYKFDNHSICKGTNEREGCGAAIEWWITPRGKKMPMDVDEAGNCKSHFSSCPKADQFRAG